MFNIKLDKTAKLTLLLVGILVVYTAVLLYSQSIRSVSYWDIFVYLQNAMLFSGHNIGSQLALPPVFSLLVAIPFNLGFISLMSMYIVAGILFILLVLGIFKLFCEKFSTEASLVCSLIFSMLTLVVTWALTGATDIPALTFSVWAVVFTIYGLNRNFNYYYLAFSCLFLSFFTRYTSGFILLVMGVYLLININKVFDQIRCDRQRFFRLSGIIILAGIVISAIYLFNQGTIPFISQFVEVSSSSQVSSINIGYDLNPFYYLENLPELLTSTSVCGSYDETLSIADNTPTILSYVILLLSAVGILTFIKDVLSRAKRSQRIIKSYPLYLVLLAVLSIFTIFTYNDVSYLVTEVLFIVLLLFTYSYNKENIDQLDLIMFLWIGIYLILHSYHPVKVDRYILPIFIPLIYFMCLSLEKITWRIPERFTQQHPKISKNSLLIVLVIILILIIPINALYINSITHPNPYTQQEQTSASWLMDYDGNLQDNIISSDRGVAYSWYLDKYTYSTIPRVLEANNQTLEDSLKEINATYYIDSRSRLDSINGYHVIYDNHNYENPVKIYERN